MNVTNYLAQSGLDEKESHVYLSLLQLQEATVLEISKKAGIKRPTTYVILDQLERQRLVTKTGQGKAISYKANSPARLIEIMNQKRALLERVMPSLLTIYKNDPSIPAIKIKKGIEAIRLTYKELVDSASGSMYRFGDMLAFSEITGFDHFYLLDVFKNRGLVVKDLLGSSEYEKNLGAQQKDENYQVRFYNSPQDSFSIVTNNKLYMFTLGSSPHVMVIDDKRVHDAYTTLIEMAWNASGVYK